MKQENLGREAQESPGFSRGEEVNGPVLTQSDLAHGPEYQGTWGPPTTGVWIPA